MYVYGGLNHSHFLGDFWRFSMDASAWASVPTPAALPPLAGHTLTYRGQQEAASLLLVGGASPQYGFLEAPWEYSVSSGRWARLVTSGTAPVGVYGHSAVYHAASGALYVYGGHCFKLHGVGLCRDLYALHYARRHWALLSPRPTPTTRGPPPPPPRAFHAAVTTPDYMVVLGGQVAAPPAPAQGLLAYSYACNAWLPLAPPHAALVGPALAPSVATAAAATAAPPAIYLFGGYNGTALGSLLQVWVPPDLCALNANQSQCKSVMGCASCVVVGRDSANASLCYSNAGEEPSLCRAATEKQVVVGVPCAASPRHDPTCEQRESCAACLGEWPPRSDAQQRCQWCHSLARGRCVPRDADCPREEVCGGGGAGAGGGGSGCHSVREAEQCQEAACVASDCDKCQGPMACIWTRQVRRRKQVGHYDLQETPSLNWNCVNTTIKQHLSYPVQSSPPGSCPPRCHRHTSCAACLAATGAEGGWHECRWSPALQECLSPSYVPLRCLGGACGLVLAGGPDQCPPPCASFTQCAQCLAQPRCGWCALSSPVGGLGRCVAGSLSGPDLANCAALDYTDLLATVQANASLAALHGFPPASQEPPQPQPSWHYLTCPAEDECRNGHHECRPASQTCRDLPHGYQCVCAAGYNMTAPGQCAPVCSQGCERGTCVLPDVCACHFGYVGANCSTQCLCHGHSNCAGPDQLETCLQCHNNTTGATCHLCSPNFVGDPPNGVPCVSCRHHCHGHATLCVAPDQAAAAAAAGTNASLAGEEGTEAPEPPPLPPHGPGEDAECVQCANNTAGGRCQTCLEGFFRGSKDLRRGCRPCQCNGHGSTCDAVWGTGCDCGNNTETDKQCLEGGKGRGGGGGGAGERDEECWQHQCAKCADAYLGSPSGGHQCYLQMNVDKDYCLDPEGQSQCSSGPAPLPPRRTVFFAVQPKFMNVDIRLVLDVTEGGADVFFSSRGDAFVVAPPHPGAAPALTIDPQYLRSAGVGGGDESGRSGGGGSGGGGNGTVESRLVQREGRGLKTFATVTRAAEILVVRNVTNRLVVTLPQHHHDLRSAKFYLAVQGVGRPGRPLTWGSVFFRQDQPRIDLFVFFSVFFSCFFLFLAVCVVAWKVKQGLDLQRLRRQHMVQMLHMAKRPCAAATLLLHPEDAATAAEPPLDHTLWSPGRRKRAAKRERDGLQVGPLAVEPTDDGVAAVLTLMVQLPGGGLGGTTPNPHAPTHRLALGSSLCLMSRIFPPASRPFHLRRRTSHLAP
ncbi:Multiple epidermal growth factor-like domains protein 8 [Portunus trituberculatus]|uniref:Multiple epidermal growth factor-like domains protein 8 n=2 Tax=Portunus trituberculatus TaxID=210409 RepID=A0A5B7GQK6_PORTR|nr:Multiple epidermal growth factor-like domains protein 8 [Portunus trituberculatus]